MEAKSKQYGFSSLEVLLLIAVAVLIAGTGYYVWHSQHSATPAVVQKPPLQTQPQPKSTQPCDKSCLDTAFQQVKIPASLTFVSKTWTYIGPSQMEPVAPNAWVYSYSVPASQQQQSEAALYKAEAAAGFTLRQLEAGPTIAYSKNVEAEIINEKALTQKDGTTPLNLVVESPQSQ